MILISSYQMSAQLDNNSRNTDKGTVDIISLKTTKRAEKTSSIELKGNNGFKNAFDKEKEKLKRKKSESDFNNKGILTKKMLRRNLFKQYMEKNSIQIPMIDKDIGVFNTTSVDINIDCFDYGIIDGDKITILKNNIPIVINYVLKREFTDKVIKIPLDIGFNKIEILATSEGQFRPNSGAFTLFDNFKKEVFSDFWMLAKGAKVIAHIIRIK
jgi:hypothetical protein